MDLNTQKRYSSKFKEKNKLKVPTMRLETIFNNLKINNKDHIPLLSIDVEGFDEIVLTQAMKLKNVFDVIIIEDKLINLSKPFPQSEIGKIAQENNYVMVGKTLLNSIYIKSDSNIFDWIPETMRK